MPVPSFPRWLFMADTRDVIWKAIDILPPALPPLSVP
jgi:hypothetical protein